MLDPIILHPSSLLALFQQIPDISIPGVPTEYMPTQSAQAVTELFDKIFKDSLKLLAVTTLIGAAATVVFPLVGEDGSSKNNWSGFLKRMVVTVLLLFGLQFIFGSILDLGHGIGQEIFKDQDVSKLNQQFSDNANKAQQEKAVPEDGKPGGVLGVLKGLTDMVSLFQANNLIGLIGGLSAILFFLTTIVINLLWRVLVIILYITAPIIIVTLPIPGVGTKLVTSWLAATIQISLWPVWFSICAFFVNTSDSIFKVSDDVGKTVNHIDSIAHAVIFTILYLATPKFISIVFPISTFSSSASAGLTSGIQALASTAAKLSGVGGAAGVAKTAAKAPPRKPEKEKPEPVGYNLG